MREIKIKRKKSFFACLIPYFCVVNCDIRSFKESFEKGRGRIGNDFKDSIYTISNGKEISITNFNTITSFFLFAFTANGPVYSDIVPVDMGTNDLEYWIETKYHWVKGIRFRIHNIK